MRSPQVESLPNKRRAGQSMIKNTLDQTAQRFAGQKPLTFLIIM
ncbi:hypothetical protein PO124_16945 [Bacillus licheniformis]|nr:hypothetical protein [Bacillus licheniformis]